MKIATVGAGIGGPTLALALRQHGIEAHIYEQAATLTEIGAAAALSAWQTGDFSSLMAYPGTVPHPLNKGYNVTPKSLQSQYRAALKRFPGLPPSETATPLPAPPL